MRPISTFYSQGPILSGQLVYCDEDHAFDFAALDRVDADQASIVFDTVQLEVDTRSGRCLYAWGYSPRTSWQAGQHEAVPSIEGELSVSTDVLRPDVGVALIDSGEAITTHDPEKGTVRILSVHGPALTSGVVVAKGVTVLLSEDYCVAGLELHPS